MSAARPHPTLHGTGELVRLNLRVDRLRAALWTLGVAGLILASAASVRSLYSTPAQVAQYASLLDAGPSMAAVNRAFNGPGFGFDHPNVGVVLVNEVAAWGTVAFAFLAVFVTARHTRADEDAERTEILRSRMVGRHAVLAAAAITVGGQLALAAVVTLAGLLAMGYALVGTCALVAGYLSAGLVFAAATALAAQVASTARGTIGFGVAALGSAFVVRAIGDMGSGRLSWLSPIGWVHRVRPFAGEQWWVLAIPLVVVVGASGAAVVLADRRNLGAGLLHQRLGPERAGPITIRPIGLVARLQLGSIVGWSVGVFVLGVAYGSVAADIDQLFRDNPDLQQYIAVQGQSITDSYLAYTLALAAMLVGGYATSSVLRLRSEEADGRLELVLAHPTSRLSWMVDHLVVALSGSAIALVVSGLGTGIGVALALGDGSEVARLVAASVALLPTAIALIGFTALFIGFVPRFAHIAWTGLVAMVVVGLFGDLLELPQWVRDVSPLQHLAAAPAVPFDAGAFVVVTVTGLVLSGVGLAGFRRRDIPSV